MTTLARRAMLSVAALIFALLMWLTLTSYSPVPLVDGWPVYSRLMQYILGEIDLKTYLLSPHGAHPHSIVYALYRIDLHYGGRQMVPHLASVAAIAATAIVMAWWVRSAIIELGERALASFGGAAALIMIPTLSTEVLAPFQVVLSASRLVYCVALVSFALLLKTGRNALAFGLLAVSCALVTFHGSGLLFGVLVLVQHILLARSWLQRLAGAAPLITSILYTRSWLPPGAGELAGVSNWLKSFEPSYVLDLATSSFAYYAVPLVPLWPNPADRWPLICFGAILAIVTTLWALFTILKFRTRRATVLGLAFIVLFVTLSAVSAALVWESRRVLGFPGEPELNIMHSERYTSVALLAYALVTIPLLTLPLRWLDGGRTAIAVIATLLVACNFWTFREREELTDNLDKAATALFAGAEITDQPAEFVWPAVSQDWYWPKQLVKVVDFAAERHIGFAYGLPQLGSKPNALWQSAVQAPVVQGTSVPGVCSIAGTIPPIDRDVFSAPHFLGVLDTGGVVIGAVSVPVATDETKVTGHVRCPGGPASITSPEVVAAGEIID